MANLVKVARYRNSLPAATFGVPVPLNHAANQIHRRYGVAISHALTVATMVNAGIVASAKDRR
jgi:hypothetical protein